MRIERQLLFWLVAGIGLLLGIALLKDVLLPFVVGMVIAYFLNPVADRLEAAGLGRMAAAGLIVLAVGIILVAAMVFLLPFAANQLRLLAETMPEDLARVKTSFEAWMAARLGDRLSLFKEGLDRAIQELSQSWSASTGMIARTLWKQGLAVMNFLSLLLVTPVVVFYLLVDWHPMIAKVDGWLPRDHAATIRRLAGEINAAVSAFIRGQGTICMILGLFYAVALMLAGIRYGALIGLGTGLLAFVPYVGWGLGLIAALAVAVIQSTQDMLPVVKVAGIFAAGMALDTAVLSPKIVGEKIGLHPVWLMFALFVFSYLFGFVGVLVAVPVAAAIAVLVRFALDLYLGSSVYRGTGAHATGISGAPGNGMAESSQAESSQAESGQAEPGP